LAPDRRQNRRNAAEHVLRAVRDRKAILLIFRADEQEQKKTEIGRIGQRE
jgi:hypothetical protein